jgi:hypothetical protein
VIYTFVSASLSTIMNTTEIEFSTGTQLRARNIQVFEGFSGRLHFSMGIENGGILVFVNVYTYSQESIIQSKRAAILINYGPDLGSVQIVGGPYLNVADCTYSAGRSGRELVIETNWNPDIIRVDLEENTDDVFADN